ncbi:MAG: glycerate kinase [Tissierellia bacterium]|nr:glycerate kinase [Tissierellia bacterium]
MKITIMMDSFKGCFSSLEVGNIIKSIVETHHHEAVVLPIADGGEGTVESLKDLNGSKEVTVEVHDPFMRSHRAHYLVVDDNIAILEMSASSGLPLVGKEKNPMVATTYGVGDMIVDALDRGIRNFIVGIGGSATNDGGIGMLERLGVRFLDDNDQPIDKGPRGITQLSKIDLSGLDSRIKESRFQVACDVDNPLCGNNGASYVYGPQKGASPTDVKRLDQWLEKYHHKTLEVIKEADALTPGVGAAGGLGYAFRNYLQAELRSGIELVLEMLDAESLIKKSDLIITGEGKMDFQTSMGKTPVGIAKLAKKHHKKVIAFCGVCDNDAQGVNQEGIDAFFPIINTTMSLEKAIDRKVSRENLERCTRQVFNLIDLWR